MFLYKAFPVSQTIAVIVAMQRVDETHTGYVASDSVSDGIRAALGEGFRWVRTECEMAVFECEVGRERSIVLDPDVF